MENNDILNFIKKRDRDLYELISDRMTGHHFSVKDRPGVTFLFPATEEMNSILYSEDEDQVDKLLQSLIIYDDLSSPDHFRNHSDDLPNARKQHLEIDLSKSRGNIIKTKSGAVIQLNNKFEESKKTSNMHIYDITSGVISDEGPPAKFTYFRSIVSNGRKKAPVVQTPVVSYGEFPNKNSITLRKKIAKETENQYTMDIINMDTTDDENDNFRNIYLDKVISLIGFMYETCSDAVRDNIIIRRILPLLSFEHIDFYLLFEPFQETGRYIIPSMYIENWYVSEYNGAKKSIVKTICGLFNTHKTNKNAPKVLSARMDIQNEIETIRGSIVENQPKKYIDAVINQYSNISSNNSIGSLNNIYPEELASIYSGVPFKKMAQDEIRFISYCIFEKLELGGFDANLFSDALNKIKNYLSDGVSANTLSILNSKVAASSLSNTKIAQCTTFIHSKFFMFSPMTLDEFKTFTEEYEVTEDRSGTQDGSGLWYSMRTINNFLSYKYNAKNTIDIDDTDRILNMIKIAKANGKKIDPSILETIKNIIEE